MIEKILLAISYFLIGILAFLAMAVAFVGAVRIGV